MIDLTQVPLKDLLGFAIRSEIDSNQAYTHLSNRVHNPLLKEKFRWLAFEENKHKEMLENLFTSLLPDEKLVVPPEPSKQLLKKITITPSSGLLDLLLQAMESEQTAEEFYGGLADKVSDPHRKILSYLSRVEHSHYQMLKSEYALAQEFGDYGEKDIDKVVT